MATLKQLVNDEHLVSLGGGLDSDELPERLLYAMPHVVVWLEEVLQHIPPDFDEGRQSALEQVDDLFHDFVSGEDMSFWERSHSMKPDDLGIWELKTPDVRVFGWFPQKGAFIIAEIDSAYRCKLHRLYAGYRDSAVRRRNGLDLDEPKFVPGGYRDVL